MNAHFERTGSLTELTSYPRWAQDMIAESEDAKRSVVEHEMWQIMREAQHDLESISNFMTGIWPVIERFPGYMAHSLLKTRYGRSHGENLARRWLVRNIRVEQNHAEYFLDWAEGEGVSREEVLNGLPVHGTQVLANWCEDISTRGSLPASLAATNFAIEGVTGEWAQLVYDSPKYRESFQPKIRKQTLRWLQLHAAYDDTHPWEALEIICTLVGMNPMVDQIMHLGECIRRSYTSMRILGDRCLTSPRILEPMCEAAA